MIVFLSRNPVLSLISWCLGPEMFFILSRGPCIALQIVLYPLVHGWFSWLIFMDVLSRSWPQANCIPLRFTKQGFMDSLYRGQWPQSKCLGSQPAHSSLGSLSPQQTKTSQTGSGFPTVRKSKNSHPNFSLSSSFVFLSLEILGTNRKVKHYL